MEELLSIQGGLEHCKRIMSMALDALKHTLTPEEEETIYAIFYTQGEILLERATDLIILSERLERK